MQDPSVRGPTGTVIVAGITSTRRAHGPLRIVVAADSLEGRQMGLVRDSAIALDDLTRIPEAFLFRHVGSCPWMREVEGILRRLFGL